VRMKLDALLRAAQILRSQPACAMPLVKLHARLAQELGPDLGSYADLYSQLKNRPQSFLIIDSPRLLPDTGGWPRHVREAYDVALQGAGLGACVRVALTELPNEGRDGDPLAFAGATVGELWAAADKDPTLLAFVTRAAQQLQEICAVMSPDASAEHPTIPLPHPPP